ncbi:hypothetical protein BZG36_00026 [Bifiguratus adelaidae]|uniref:Actin-related protein 5 n=1 Tax=Bifiguratus adelaidae TaxID=1938954 RepID=A0A261Y8B0_9FUNG|nr:hypothetical protein BZG36_00026 [Bifiguratus adelaidae]
MDGEVEGNGHTEWPIYELSDSTYPSVPISSVDYEDSFEGTGIPLVIDNGSYQCRAGWANETRPRVAFDSIVSKYKDRRTNTSTHAVGNEIYQDKTALTNAKSPFDANIVCEFERMEYILDYVFLKLGISTDSVEHPIVMTEAVCNPRYNRGLMSELLFEAYSVPKVTYGIDALFSFHANGHSLDDGGIAISCGHNMTHVIPILHGRGVLEQTKRISYGGTQATDYMLRLLQLKYPTFPTKVTPNQAQQIVHNYTYTPEDYFAELDSFKNRDKFPAADRILQVPFTAPVVEEKTEEELAKAAARREEQARKMRETAAKSRLEKLVQRETEFEAFTELKAMKATEKKSDWLTRLKNQGFKDEADLDEVLKQTEEFIKKARRKELGSDEMEEKGEPSFPLVDIPDDQLSEADRKEKRKQKLLKAGHEARLRAKKAKEEEKARQLEANRLEEEYRLAHPEQWADEMHAKRKLVIEKIKDRRKKAQQLSDRRSHASQQRMRSLASLASDTPSSKRRKKGIEAEDTFGADDQDWMVYREISKEEDEEEEDEDLAILNEIEANLLRNDPTFKPEDVFEAEESPENSLLHLFAHGVYPPHDSADIAQSYQLHVNVERIRVPEVLFQPSIIGLDQAGIIETISDVMKRFEGDARRSLTKTIFLTGGFSQIPNLDNRLIRSLHSILPAGTRVNLQRAQDPLLDAWRGAAMWSNSIVQNNSSVTKVFITRQDYEEYGSEYLKAHGYGNMTY